MSTQVITTACTERKSNSENNAVSLLTVVRIFNNAMTSSKSYIIACVHILCHMSEVTAFLFVQNSDPDRDEQKIFDHHSSC